VVSAAPVVSVAIRAYRRDTLPAAIESVLAQAHRELELVVYDDARTLDDIVE
jgi:glycosyltransferase involved in cell wall biosynthesis